MNRMFYHLLATIFLLVASIPAAFSAGEKNMIIGQVEGMVVHQVAGVILQAAYENSGITMKYQSLPTNRSLLLANDGMFDGDVARIEQITQIYTNLRKVPTPLMHIRSYAYGIDPALVVNNWEEMQHLRIGLKYGLRYLDTHIDDKKVEYFISFEKAFEMLAAGRIDVVVCSDIQAQAVIESVFPDSNIRALGESVFQAPVFHFLHKKHEDLIPIIDKHIQELYDTGQHEQLLQQALLSINPG